MLHPGLPFTIDSYTFTATGLTVKGSPTFEEHEGVGHFILAADHCSGWWLADWLRYGEARQDWQPRLQQAVDVTGLSEARLKHVRATGAIEKVRRRLTVPFEHHAEVAALPADEQDQLLEDAEQEGWTRAELRQEIRAHRRRKVLDGQATLAGMYRVLYAAPRSFSTPSAVADLCKMPVGAHALPNSVLFLWVGTPFLLQNPGPRDVIEAWGFTYKTSGVWDKVVGNFGAYLQVQHEHLLICTRGDCQPDRPTPQPGSIYHERAGKIHGEHPEGIRKQWIERLYTRGPYLELFGNRPVDGWDVFGHDPRLWAEDVAS